MTDTTRTGDVLGDVYPFVKLRAGLVEATEAVEKAVADRSNISDDDFAELIERQDRAVARLAARGPTSGGEAIFLLRILRDRMDAEFDSSVIEASNRDIVRGVAAYLSDAGPVTGRPVSADDAELQSLWQRQQQLYKSTPSVDDMEAHDKWAALVREVDQKLADTPAQSMMGVAIKLQYASELVAEVTEFSDEQTLLSARNDAARLAGLEMAEPTARQGSLADRRD